MESFPNNLCLTDLEAITKMLLLYGMTENLKVKSYNLTSYISSTMQGTEIIKISMYTLA
jgi:hypothetical protein